MYKYKLSRTGLDLKCSETVSYQSDRIPECVSRPWQLLFRVIRHIYSFNHHKTGSGRFWYYYVVKIIISITSTSNGNNLFTNQPFCFLTSFCAVHSLDYFTSPWQYFGKLHESIRDSCYYTILVQTVRMMLQAFLR